MTEHRHRRNFVQRHSLSLVSSIILLTWIVLYSVSDPSTHAGSFFGNAIADWTGVLIAVLGTKYLFERGSAESRQPRTILPNWAEEFLRDHSLTIFLLTTGAGWTALFLHLNSEAKWGQVVGNIVSEWTQQIGMVLMTKRFIEPGSKESRR